MRTFAAAIVGALLIPSITFAAQPFGGPISTIIFCYNQAIYTIVGPPRGGIYIWTPVTETYPFGPPSHSGQYLLGLYGAPYYCLVTIFPVHVEAGIAMTMLGSSQ